MANLQAEEASIRRDLVADVFASFLQLLPGFAPSPAPEKWVLNEDAHLRPGTVQRHPIEPTSSSLATPGVIGGAGWFANHRAPFKHATC
jgi:hypothetical protein